MAWTPLGPSELGDKFELAVGGAMDTPATLFHGTKRRHLASIAKVGLRPHRPRWVFPPQPTAVYLTDHHDEAIYRAGPNGAVLSVDVAGWRLIRLDPPDNSTWYMSGPIPPDRITFP